MPTQFVFLSKQMVETTSAPLAGLGDLVFCVGGKFLKDGGAYRVVSFLSQISFISEGNLQRSLIS